MMESDTRHNIPLHFDKYAEEYDRELSKGLSVTGETKEYFAQERVAWMAQQLEALKAKPASVLDYGCGTGSSARLIQAVLAPKRFMGVDVSGKSLALARQRGANSGVDFKLIEEYVPRGEIEFAFCNGVFHHIAPAERLLCLDYIYRSLCEDGLFAFWENNPWNPAVGFIMRRIPFDRDAVTLTPPAARTLLREAGFKILRTDFRFIFPKMLAALRVFEPALSFLPFGGQYMILCRKS